MKGQKEKYRYLSIEERKGVELFLSRVREYLKDELVLLKLFGSKARGDYAQESDIDILVVVNGRDWDLHYKVCSIANDVALEFGANISPVILTEKEFNLNRDHGTAFYESVEKEGVPL
jgi:predicted nucleotidyltransferase